MQNENKIPKKNPLSLQMDLSKFELATEEEKAQQEVMSESTTFFKDGMRKLMKNPLAVGSIIVLVLVILLATFGPMVVPYGYDEMITIDGRRDKRAKNLAPFTWSETEQRYIDEGGSFSRTSLERMSSAGITLSGFSTEPEYPCW